MYYCLLFVAILRRWPDTDLPQTSIRDTVDFLRMKDQVETVTVNSTLGKHLINSYEHLTTDPVLQSDYTLITVIIGEKRCLSTSRKLDQIGNINTDMPDMCWSDICI